MERANWVAGVALIFLCGSASGATTTYVLTDLGAPGVYPNSAAAGISDSGIVTGRMYQATTESTPEYSRMFRWTEGGSMENLGVLEGNDSSLGTAVNNAGKVVGMSVGYSSAMMAAVYENPGPLEGIGPFLGANIFWGVNNWGTMVGDIGGGAWVSDFVNFEELDPGMLDSTARDINDNHIAVGGVHYRTGTVDMYRGRVWTLGETVQAKMLLPGAGNSYAMAEGVNEAGNRAAGKSWRNASIPGLFDYQATAWSLAGTNWTATDLPYLDPQNNKYSIAEEANDEGLLVGCSGGTALDPLTTRLACLWEENAPGIYTAHDLNTLVLDKPFSWTLHEATDINASGQIVGTMSYGGGESLVYHAFLLTPVPEPTTMVMLAGLAVVGMGIAAGRRR